MPSDLATALISGGNGNSNMLIADPAMAAIQPQLQLAHLLSQQAISTAPASPWQAGGRLAQALAGVKVGHDAQEDLANLNTGATGEMGKIFPEGTPIGDGLRSQSGLVRMLAMQQAGKAMLLNSQDTNLSPGQARVAPATPRSGGGVVGLNPYPVSRPGQENFDLERNPAMAPNLAAAAGQKAGATAAAELPYKPIKRVIDTPRGPEMTEQPAVELGGLGGNAPIVPKAVTPQIVRADTARPGVAETGRAPGAAKIPDRVPPLPATAPGADAGGNFNDRFTGVRGEPVKTPEFLGDVAGREKLFGGANEAIGKVIGEHIEAGGKASRDKLNALDTIETALRTGGKNVITGPNAEFALKAREALNGMGLNADWVNKGLPESEIVSKMNAQLASASAKAMTGRPTQAEFLIWQRNNPGLATSKEGSLALIDILRQQAHNDVELGKMALNKKNWENWGDVSEKFNAEHGLKNPLTGKLMRDEISAARGSGGAASAPGARSGASMPVPAMPPVAGARQGADGLWYVSDPDRAGKFLRVDH